MIFEVITLVLLTVYAVIMLAYCYGWHKALTMPFLNRDLEFNHDSFICVIVPARNEALQISACLNSLLNQDYPSHLYEIIVINDGSTDQTANVVRGFKSTGPNIRLFDLKPRVGLAFKKYAIEQGIEHAKDNSIIVCTDADCTHHPSWLRTIAGGFRYKNVRFIAAPVVYHTYPNLLSVFQTLDFMTLQGITASSVTLNWHSMCNGANLAYTKNAFAEVEGFAGIDNLPTGDDMLLMHKISKRFEQGSIYMCQPEAMVYTHAVDSWKGFFMQRIRWASKAAYFEDKRIFAVLFLVFVLNVWLIVLASLSFFETRFFYQLVTGMLIKTVFELIFLVPVARFYKKVKWLWWFPFLQPLHILYTVTSAWLGRFSTYQWKGRRIEKPSSVKAF